MDTCCLNRPFDPPAETTRSEAADEAEAVILLLERIARGEAELAWSETLDWEISRTPDREKVASMMAFFRLASPPFGIEADYADRARSIAATLGIKNGLDALHLAAAERTKSTVFLTTDYPLLRKASRRTTDLGVRVANPRDYLQTLVGS